MPPRHRGGVEEDLDLAFALMDIADAATMRVWQSHGVPSTAKPDGTPVTEADVAAETAMLRLVQNARPRDGFLGEEVGEHGGRSGRRWIADGIDGTRHFAAGRRTWGTLLALEVDAEIVLGIASSPAQSQRWWATRGAGAYKSSSATGDVRRLFVSSRNELDARRAACLPSYSDLSEDRRRVLRELLGGRPAPQQWCHQLRVAEGELELCVWWAGDIWDHAAPCLILEEAGGRFSDHAGGRRLDTRTAIYSNGRTHDDVINALQRLAPQS